MVRKNSHCGGARTSDRHVAKASILPIVPHSSLTGSNSGFADNRSGRSDNKEDIQLNFFTIIDPKRFTITFIPQQAKIIQIASQLPGEHTVLQAALLLALSSHIHIFLTLPVTMGTHLPVPVEN